jgi:hypothetical protein
MFDSTSGSMRFLFVMAAVVLRPAAIAAVEVSPRAAKHRQLTIRSLMTSLFVSPSYAEQERYVDHKTVRASLF